jgi:hypothetical protein
LDRRLGGPQSRSGRGEGKIISCLCGDFIFPVTILTELFELPLRNCRRGKEKEAHDPHLEDVNTKYRPQRGLDTETNAKPLRLGLKEGEFMDWLFSNFSFCLFMSICLKMKRFLSKGMR